MLVRSMRMQLSAHATLGTPAAACPCPRPGPLTYLQLFAELEDWQRAYDQVGQIAAAEQAEEDMAGRRRQARWGWAG